MSRRRTSKRKRLANNDESLDGKTKTEQDVLLHNEGGGAQASEAGSIRQLATTERYKRSETLTFPP
jgi:hypothetical protein